MNAMSYYFTSYIFFMFEVLGVQVNLLAIVLAAVASVVVGTLWYSDFLFGKMWRDLMGKNNADLQMKTTDMLMAVVVALLMAVGLNSVLQFSHQVTGLMGLPNILLTAGMIVFTFVVPTELNNVIWEGKRKKLFLLNTLHHLVEYVVMGIVIAWIV